MQKIFTLCLLIFVFAIVSANAQYGWFPKQFSESLYRIHSFDTTMAFIRTSTKDIYKSYDQGKNWDKITSPPERFRKICFNSPDNVIAISFDKIYRSANGGYQWSDITFNETKTYSLVDMAFVDENVGFVAGSVAKTVGSILLEDFLLLKTTNGGNSWNRIIADSIPHVEKIFFIDQTYGWLYTFNGQVWATTNSGSKWQLLDGFGNIAEPDEIINDIKFFNHLDGILCTSKKLYASSNSGFTWQKIDLPDNIYPMSVFFFDKQNGYVSGGGNIYKTNDAGRNWTKQHIKKDGAIINPSALHFITPSRGFAFWNNFMVRTATAGNDVDIFEASITVDGNEPACQGDSLALTVSPNLPNISYHWSTGDTATSISVGRSGTYSVYLERDDYSNSKASVTLAFYPLPDFNIIGDSVICQGDIIELRPDKFFDENHHYLWSTGDTTDAIFISSIGEYSLLVTNQFGCTFADSFNVRNRVLKLDCDVDFFAFDSVEVGSQLQHSIKFRNNDDLLINLSDVSLRNATAFRIVNADDFPASVLPSEEIEVVVEFSPYQSIAYSDTLYLDIISPCPGKVSLIIAGYGKPIVSVADNFEQPLLVFPNPVFEKLKFNILPKSKILIYSVYGEKVLESTPSLTIDVSSLASGVYIVIADNEIIKFIKRSD